MAQPAQISDPSIDPDAPAVITRISRAVRGLCRIFLDNKSAFPCPAGAIEPLNLRVGTPVTPELRVQIDDLMRQGKCRAAALRLLGARDHSSAELTAKLQRRFEPSIVKDVIDDLTRRDVVNDVRFAKAKAESAARRGHQGPARALSSLHRSGIPDDVAATVVRELYKPDDRRAIAMDLARRHLARLNQFPRPIARQRLFGLLARRGFDEDDVLNVVEKMLGPAGE